mmetsp:Transcript_12240/g.23448  ORF Transcript_12240/g.23448 Transcript_12240/m.23448 type:complete len:173 (+) Transcript_12240:1008-1526(+)
MLQTWTPQPVQGQLERHLVLQGRAAVVEQELVVYEHIDQADVSAMGCVGAQVAYLEDCSLVVEKLQRAAVAVGKLEERVVVAAAIVAVIAAIAAGVVAATAEEGAAAAAGCGIAAQVAVIAVAVVAVAAATAAEIVAIAVAAVAAVVADAVAAVGSDSAAVAFDSALYSSIK